jgi:hypothetical protein
MGTARTFAAPPRPAYSARTQGNLSGFAAVTAAVTSAEQGVQVSDDQNTLRAGDFENYEPLTDITRADVFSEAGLRTPAFVRFPTVAGNKGSGDLAAALFEAAGLPTDPSGKCDGGHMRSSLGRPVRAQKPPSGIPTQRR